MLVWVLAGALAGAVVAVVALTLMLRRARERAADTTRLADAARAEIRSVVAIETEAHREEIRRTLARERAETISLLAAEERRLGEEARASFTERERRAGEGHAVAIAAAEHRLEERLRGFATDLERAQSHVEAQLERLRQQHREAIAGVETRITAEASELGSAADEQRRVVLRLREELERAAGQAVTEALDELEAQTLQRRRAIEEITERLRQREAAVADSIERAETDVRTRLDVLLVEWERRQTDRLERVTEREIERHAQIASQAYDERMREIREEASTRLRRELDRTIEALAKEELVRRVEELPS
jgi:hypothetical protein